MIDKIKTIHFLKKIYKLSSCKALRALADPLRVVFSSVPLAASNWQYVWSKRAKDCGGVFLMRLNHLVIYDFIPRLFLHPGINLWKTRLRLGTCVSDAITGPLKPPTNYIVPLPLRLCWTVVHIRQPSGEQRAIKARGRASWGTVSKHSLMSLLPRVVCLAKNTAGQSPLFRS